MHPNTITLDIEAIEARAAEVAASAWPYYAFGWIATAPADALALCAEVRRLRAMENRKGRRIAPVEAGTLFDVVEVGNEPH